VVAKFREGLNMAGKFLGLNTAQGVAHLVSTSLLNARPQWLREGPAASLQHGLFSGFLKLLGLDSTKLGAIALNAIIFMAQLVSTQQNYTTTQLQTFPGSAMQTLKMRRSVKKYKTVFRGVTS
jgi:hypothetical protein